MSGYFGPVTSNINWCETDYQVTHYIAEFFNTISNIPPILLSAIALYCAFRKFKNTKEKCENLQPVIIAFLYVGAIVTYTGSLFFHATLSYTGQLCDELPMIFGTLYVHFVLSSRKKIEKMVAGFYIGIGIGITVIMVLLRESPLPLQIFYGILVVTLVVRLIRESLALPIALKSTSTLLHKAIFYYSIGWIGWFMDKDFCDFSKPFFLHAFWHLLSGVGTYYKFQFVCAAHMISEENELKLASLGTFSFVVSKQVTQLSLIEPEYTPLIIVS